LRVRGFEGAGVRECEGRDGDQPKDKSLHLRMLQPKAGRVDGTTRRMF
jgi:hypothetical protein